MEEQEIIQVIIGGALIVLLLIAFLLFFFLIHTRRQQANALEKSKLKADFEQELISSKSEVQEQTMKHIARELHDNIGQILSLVKIQLNNLEVDLPKNQRLSDSNMHLQKAIKDLRLLSKTLNAENLMMGGLQEAIFNLMKQIKNAEIIDARYSTSGEEFQFPDKINLMIFRLFQELINNTIKHSKASHVDVQLTYDEAFLILSVNDNGVGFDLQKEINKKSGSGLSNLYYRAKLLNGHLNILTDATNGTFTQLSIPYTTMEN